MRAAIPILVAAAAGCSSGSTPAPAQAADHKDYLTLEANSPSLAYIKVEEVKESDAGTGITLTGRVAFNEDHTQRVASPIDGRATAILVHPGDRVHAGQALIELSSPHVGELQANAQKAQQDLSVAQKGIDRAHKLREDGAISDKEVAQAEADFKKAKAEVASTSAQLKSLGLSASDPAVNIALRSQISGTVVERNILVGQEVRADSAAPLLTISDVDTMWVQADIYEQDLALVQTGAEVTVRVAAYPGEGFTGKVSHIGDVVDPQTRTVKIRCLVPNPGQRLKAEMFAKVEVQNASGRKVIVIPTRAVLTEGDSTKVIVATGDRVFRARPIDVGPEVDGMVRVLGRLKAGEKIVTDGAIFLKNELETH
jgi:cobalt-zinc-cadmium efflux system membrane fusion protein